MSGLEGTRDILFLILSVEKVHVMPCLKPLHETNSVRAPKIGQALEKMLIIHLFLSFLPIHPGL